MFNRLPFLAVAFCFLMVTACKKSNNSGGTGSNPLTGNWTFAGEATNADITSTFSVGPLSIKVVNLLVFRTIDNVGNLTFTSDSLNAVGVGYTIDTTYTTYTYTGFAIDTSVSPLMTTANPTTTTASYKLIGSDSIYFPNGSPFSLNIDSIQPPIQINGAHFKISGNALTFTSTINQSGNETIGGITAPTTGLITSVITLNKQ